MKIHRSFLLATLLGTLVAPTAMYASTATAATTTQIRFTNAYSHNASDRYKLTVCLDDSPIANLGTNETSDPITVETGVHTASVMAGFDSDCTEAPLSSDTITIPEGVASTLVAWLPLESRGEVTVFPDDLTCVPAADLGRVTFRNMAAYSGGDPFDLQATPPMQSTPAGLVPAVGSGDQGSALIPTGTYSSFTANETLTHNFVADLVTSLTFSETTRYVVYAYGGSDGDIGGFASALPSTVCGEEPTTTTTAVPNTNAPTTTVAAAEKAKPATPIAAKPTYTG